MPDPVLSQHPDTDPAFIPNALPNAKEEYIPILPTELHKIGKEIYTFGFFKLGAEIERAYFAGRIVNMKMDGEKDIHHVLPFAVLEGMSGSPIMTYHNGPKLMGVARGNRRSRILASEVLDLEENGTTLRETIHRVVEFGIATHSAAAVDFLKGIGVNSFVKTDATVAIPGLE